MLKGILSGVFWGGLLSALGLAGLSLYAPPPASPQNAANPAQERAPASDMAAADDQQDGAEADENGEALEIVSDLIGTVAPNDLTRDLDQPLDLPQDSEFPVKPKKQELVSDDDLLAALPGSPGPTQPGALTDGVTGEQSGGEAEAAADAPQDISSPVPSDSSVAEGATDGAVAAPSDGDGGAEVTAAQDTQQDDPIADPSEPQPVIDPNEINLAVNEALQSIGDGNSAAGVSILGSGSTENEVADIVLDLDIVADATTGEPAGTEMTDGADLTDEVDLAQWAELDIAETSEPTDDLQGQLADEPGAARGEGVEGGVETEDLAGAQTGPAEAPDTETVALDETDPLDQAAPAADVEQRAAAEIGGPAPEPVPTPDFPPVVAERAEPSIEMAALEQSAEVPDATPLAPLTSSGLAPDSVVPPIQRPASQPVALAALDAPELASSDATGATLSGARTIFSDQGDALAVDEAEFAALVLPDVADSRSEPPANVPQVALDPAELPARAPDLAANAVEPLTLSRAQSTESSNSASPDIVQPEGLSDPGARASEADLTTATQPAPVPSLSEAPDLNEAAGDSDPSAQTSPQRIAASTPLGLDVPDMPVLTEAAATSVVTDRLPRIAPAPEPQPSQSIESAAASTTSEAPAPTIRLGNGPVAGLNTGSALGAQAPTGDALDANAASFDGATGAALFSVVVIDAGEEGLKPEKLAEAGLPVSIAIDPTRPDAQARMAAYRAAGLEVMALAADLPAGASPGEVATAVSGYTDLLGQSMALLDPLDGRIVKARSLLDPVLSTLKTSGHGFLTYRQGLGSAEQTAARVGVPAATIFRVLDAEGEHPNKIKRYLSRAAFAAKQDGSVIVLARSFPESMAALAEWALEQDDSRLQLAPVSAVLKGAGQRS